MEGQEGAPLQDAGADLASQVETLKQISERRGAAQKEAEQRCVALQKELKKARNAVEKSKQANFAAAMQAEIDQVKDEMEEQATNYKNQIQTLKMIATSSGEADSATAPARTASALSSSEEALEMLRKQFDDEMEKNAGIVAEHAMRTGELAQERSANAALRADLAEATGAVDAGKLLRETLESKLLVLEGALQASRDEAQKLSWQVEKLKGKRTTDADEGSPESRQPGELGPEMLQLLNQRVWDLDIHEVAVQREAAVEEEEESDEEEALSFEELRRRKLDAFKSPEKSKHRAHRSPSTGGGGGGAGGARKKKKKSGTRVIALKEHSMEETKLLIPVFVSYLTTDPGDEELQAEAARRMEEMTSNYERGDYAINCKTLSDAGAVGPLVKLLYSSNEKVLQHVLEALANLSYKNDQTCQAVYTGGESIPRLVELLNHGHEAVRRWSLGLLLCLAAYEDHCCNDIAMADGLRLLMHVIDHTNVKLSSDSNHILRCATNVLLTACLRRCHICQRTNDESDATTVKVGEQENTKWRIRLLDAALRLRRSQKARSVE